jgi:hypothetical protein
MVGEIAARLYDKELNLDEVAFYLLERFMENEQVATAEHASVTPLRRKSMMRISQEKTAQDPVHLGPGRAQQPPGANDAARRLLGLSLLVPGASGRWFSSLPSK